ncbi:unnamed protein product [Orchesella dallaii]|uniref:Uncharacterized protein n=1 Tax=Orchesella dallaii TaxID=48710 RepID=A0ABP1Q2X1_9HEXA
MDPTILIILSFWAGGGVTATFILLEVCSNLYKLTQRALASMKRRKDWGSIRETKYMKKFVKSCKPLSIGYGNTYVIRKKSVLNFFKFVARGTFRALCAKKR